MMNTDDTTMNTIEISCPGLDEAEQLQQRFASSVEEEADVVLIREQPTTSSSSSGTTAAARVQPENCCDFQLGDHVYLWCSLVGIPAVYQHHGIVMDVYWRKSYEDDAAHGEWMLKIADFSNWEDDRSAGSSDNSSSSPPSKKKSSWFTTRSSNNGGKKTDGCIRTYDVSIAASSSDQQCWYKVEYQAGWWKRHWQRTGTCTAVPSDPPGLVRARVQFLIEHGVDCLPKYNTVTANCECVAVWCKTGTWATLQAVNWLLLTAAGQAKSAVTVATAAAATQVTVPAAGLWGWLGYTTHASLLSTQPYLLPAIAAYGVITAGAPALWLARANQQAKQITIQLNTAFWEQAIDHPDIFVECITEWSVRYEPPADVEPTDLTGTEGISSEDAVTVVEEEKVHKEHSYVTKTKVKVEVAPDESRQSTGQQSVEGPATKTRISSVVLLT